MTDIHLYGTKEEPFEVVMGGHAEPDDEIPRVLAILWLESVRVMRSGLD